jgi:hypothetical protein
MIELMVKEMNRHERRKAEKALRKSGAPPTGLQRMDTSHFTPDQRAIFLGEGNVPMTPELMKELIEETGRKEKDIKQFCRNGCSILSLTKFVHKATGEHVNLGLARSTRTTLQNGASIAGLMLTTEAMIADVQDDKSDSGWAAWVWQCNFPGLRPA